MHDPLVFALTVIAILGTPGPTNTLLATSGALVGVRRSLPLILAELTGYLTAIAGLYWLLGGLIAGHPFIGTALRLAIGAYLLKAAFDLWRRGGPVEGARVIDVRRVFVTTLLNPKAIVFAFGVIPLSRPDAGLYLAAFAALIVAAASAWIGLGAWLGRVAARPGSRLIPRTSALVLAGFAALIAAG